jgi:hypothetical protein
VTLPYDLSGVVLESFLVVDLFIWCTWWHLVGFLVALHAFVTLPCPSGRLF